MPVDLPAQQAIMDAVDTYASRVGVNNQSPIVRQQLGNLRSLFNANGNRPVLTGVQYGALRSSLGEEIRNAADFHSADALRAIQDQLDNAAEARLGQINPNLQGQLADARRQYRLYLDLERAVANAPAHIAGEGQITPSSLRGGVKGTEGNRRLVTGQSEFTNLANDAAVAMSSVPESGTSARTAARVLPAVAAQGHPLAALGSLLAPIGMGRVLMSGPVQQMLMSAPQDARAALTALIAAGQARKQGQEGWR
jgi:hypothetical protein